MGFFAQQDTLRETAIIIILVNGMDSLRSNRSMQDELQMVLTLKNAKEYFLAF